MAVAPVIDGYAQGADAYGAAAFLLAFAAAGALVAGAAVGGRHAGAPYLAMVGAAAAFVAATLLVDGWILLNAGQLQAEARARPHHLSVPWSDALALVALVAAALVLRRRRQ